MRWILAVVLSSVVAYAWGFAFFTLSGLPEKVIHQVEDNAATGEVLREHFPENGVYFFPSSTGDTQENMELSKAGPVAIVYMTKVNGCEMMDRGLLISGFCHTMLTSIFLCILLSLVNTSLSGWLARLGFFTFVGFLIVFYSEVGSAVWMQVSWSWQLVSALHGWGAIFIAGFIIAKIAPYPEK